MMLLANLFVATLLLVITSAIHLAGLVGLTRMIRHQNRVRRGLTSTALQAGAIMFVVMGLFALHSLEIWVYTVAYLLLGEFQDLETAVYFSTSTFTTVGFGDVVLSDDWRMLSAAESANGFLLIGWSTAFLVSLTARVRAFETMFEPRED